MFRTPRKTIIIGALVLGTTWAAWAQKQKGQEPEPVATNLKVLPKNISADSLHALMEEYSHSLGVTCGFCHAPSAQDTTDFDFASDAKGMKKKARFMIMLTAGINDQYFAEENYGSSTKMVGCYTCHHGQKEPEAFKLPKEE